MFLRYNVLSQHMPVFGKALVRPRVVDGGSYVHLTELRSLNVQHSIHKSKVTPGTYFDSFYFISCSNVHNCNIHNTLHTIYQLHTNQDAESVSIPAYTSN